MYDNNELLIKDMENIENELVKLFLRRYINGFKGKDVKALELECIKHEVSYHIVRRKLKEVAYECY